MNLQQIFNFSWASDASAWIGLLTLIALEIVLGIDNIVFISILTGKLPEAEQPKAQRTGLILAVVPRVVLLLFLPFVLSLENPLFTLPFPDPGHPEKSLGISVQDLIVIAGGLFLLTKATSEIHHKLEGDENLVEEEDKEKPNAANAYGAAIVQIVILNIVFSLDSIVTAIGMVPKEQVMVMVLAVIASTIVMAFAVNSVGKFVERHPTVKMLALSFLLLIGMTLIIEGVHFHIPKGYVYFAMGFAVVVEALNLRATSKNKPLVLRGPSGFMRRLSRR